MLWEAHERELTKLFYTSTIREAENPDIARWQRMTSLLSTRFKLVTAMANAGYCDEAEPLVDEGLALIDPQVGGFNRGKISQVFVCLFDQHPTPNNRLPTTNDQHPTSDNQQPTNNPPTTH